MLDTALNGHILGAIRQLRMLMIVNQLQFCRHGQFVATGVDLLAVDSDYKIREWCFAQPRGVHKQYATITLILAPRMMMTAYGEVHPSRLRLLRLALYPGSSWSTNVRNRIPAISSTACGRSKTR